MVTVRGFPKNYSAGILTGAALGLKIRRCDDPRGLQLAPLMRIDGGELAIDYRIGPEFEGFQGFVHGGISATLLDEAMSAFCTRVLEIRAVTGEITVRFRRPVPIESEITVRARGTREGRKVICTGEIRDRSGEVLVEGSGIWIVTSEGLEG